MAEQNNNSRGGKDPQKALPPETIPRKVPENYVDEAERIMRALISSGTTVTTSKIRNLLSLVTDIYNDESIRTEDKLKPDSVVKLNLMRVRVAYEYGRDNGESVGKDKVYPMRELITQAQPAGIPSRALPPTVRI